MGKEKKVYSWDVLLVSEAILLACKVAGYIFGYGSYTGFDGNLRGDTHEPLIGRDTESA